MTSTPAAPTTPPADGAALDGELFARQADLDVVFHLKYGAEGALGWGPRMRRARGYYSPDDHYEALLHRLVQAETEWLDVGCGRNLFPSNQGLARLLADRCARLTGVDPDATLEENPFVHERVREPMDTFRTERPFDLVTLRMVAEHVADPAALCASMAAALKPGGLAVVYTVNRRSPMPLLTGLAPMAVRHPIKKWLWGTEKKDTFPTCFKMNTRKALARCFEQVGLTEAGFQKLDDCRTFARFKALQWAELQGRRLFRSVGAAYPENCLLGLYRKPVPAPAEGDAAPRSAS